MSKYCANSKLKLYYLIRHQVSPFIYYVKISYAKNAVNVLLVSLITISCLVGPDCC